MLDIHSHILHGVDDGARSFGESCAMLAAAQSAGVTAIIATPHVRQAQWDFEKARDRFISLRAEAVALGMDLLMGYEVNGSVLAGMEFDDLSRYFIQNTRSVLLEFHHWSLPPNLERIVYAVQQAGADIILAHPERYLPADCKRARTLFDMGCEMQIDADSLYGKRSSPERRCSAAMLRRRMVTWVASDAHNEEDYRRFARTVQALPDMALCPTNIAGLGDSAPTR